MKTVRSRAADSDVEQRGAIPLWPDAAEYLSIGRTVAYREAREGRIPTIRIGGRVLVPVHALRALLGDAG